MESNLALLVIFVSNFIQNIHGSPSRLVGGNEASEHFSKFHVSLQSLSGNHVCGGAVVSAHHVVTAAHCITGAEPSHIKVVIGTTNLNEGGQQHSVTMITIHENFDFSSRKNDIAILKIFGFFDIRFVNFLKPRNDYLHDGDSVILSGFGSQEPNGDTGPIMYALNMSVFDQETCKYAMRYTREVYDEMFCTFTRIGEGTCHGDSGGPVIKNGELVGIVSWGIPCAVGFPDVHTRITPYIPWIQEKIQRKPLVC